MANANFLFTCCQSGVESALKRELSENHPELRFAFSRPGFVTFKWIADQAPSHRMQLRSVFSRTSGWSLGPVDGQDLESKLRFICEQVPARTSEHLHVWQLAPRRPAIGMPTIVTEASQQMGEQACQRLIAANRLCNNATLNGQASSGDYVIDLVVLGSDEIWMGWHQVATFGQRWPGGVPDVVVPNPMVSRAFLKMYEAMAWSGFPFRAGDRCVDLGSSPGGTSQALLSAGLRVTGIDPAEMNPAVLENPDFVHLRKRGADVRRREYRGHKWLVADANVVPTTTLSTLESIVTHPSTSIQGLLITLKLADWQQASEIPGYVQRVQSWGYRDVRCRQLASNHQEVCLAALRSRGMRRRRRRSPNQVHTAD